MCLRYRYGGPNSGLKKRRKNRDGQSSSWAGPSGSSKASTSSTGNIHRKKKRQQSSDYQKQLKRLNYEDSSSDGDDEVEVEPFSDDPFSVSLNYIPPKKNM